MLKEASQPAGLYTPDGFESREEIMRKLAQPDTIEFITPITQDSRSFVEYGVIFDRRQKEREAAFRIPEHIEIKIHTDKPTLLIPFGDVHAGGEEVDYRRFTNELSRVAETDGAYTLTVGDLTNSMFWGGAGQDKEIGSYGEQNNYLRAGIKLLTGRRKLLAAWAGDHDRWSADRGETIYDSFKQMGVPYLEGVSYVSLWIGDQLYKISGAHKHNGFSIYNRAHPALRLYRDGAEGADVCITAHNHAKSYLQQPVKRFGGEQEDVHFLSIGAYKRSDEYLRKKGYPRLSAKEMGAQSILLWPDTKRIEVLWDVERGLERLNEERSKT